MCLKEQELRDNFDDACDTTELQEQYEILGFVPPLVKLKRKSDGVVGMMQFQHRPRVYFAFKALLLLLMTLASTANAGDLRLEYDYQTGGMTIRDIPPENYQITIRFPAQYSLVDMQDRRDTILPDRNDMSVRWLSFTQRGGGYFRNAIILKTAFGLDKDIFVGYIMQPKVDYLFEEDFTVYKNIRMNCVEIVNYETLRWDTYPTIRVNVPEPTALLLLAVAFACVSIWRMK